MASLRDRMKQQTAALATASDIPTPRADTPQAPRTMPGMIAALVTAEQRVKELEKGAGSLDITLADIDPNPWQPRKVFAPDALSELAESVREIGLIEPIVVRQAGERFQLIAGERRLRVHHLLERATIRSVIVTCEDQDMALLALAENLSREELSDYEIAQALLQTEAHFPNRKRMAEALGMSRSGLYRFFTFQKLPAFVLEDLALRPGLISSTTADELVTAIRRHGELGEQAAREVWALLLAGKLDHRKADAMLDSIVRQRGSKASSAIQIDALYTGALRAGSIQRDARGFTLKLKAGAMTSEQEVRLREFIERMFEAKPEKG
ncbi:chromosome partitioning protein ParB [Bordetella genomosp. 5]|uniref:ParB/RepB/Spo0J family partition protein n=1 Tax=Bordetella genomosp. 5 TaxID=1395608 RepID=UPI000B9E611D|nr:ParB/RepB/Spo0J family partition protein [Bordetella genomosp. 5]OZI33372.1 chromosome partitioning protein ParB [Bordetella genomosp. 5]